MLQPALVCVLNCQVEGDGVWGGPRALPGLAGTGAVGARWRWVWLRSSLVRHTHACRSLLLCAMHLQRCAKEKEEKAKLNEDGEFGTALAWPGLPEYSLSAGPGSAAETCPGVRGWQQGCCPGETISPLSWASDIGWVKMKPIWQRTRFTFAFQSLGKHRGLPSWVLDVGVDEQPEKSIPPLVS